MPDEAELPLGALPRVYRRRWLMLAVFTSVSMVNALQWTQYTIISDVVTSYYGVSTLAVSWTCMVYSVSYIPLILPASWLLDKKGLRVALVLAALGTCLGSWIKVASVSPDRFAITFLGQTVVACSQVFSLNLPARIAAVWFAPSELAIACGIGVFGNQLGVALGFVMPSLLVSDTSSVDAIGSQLQRMFYLVAGVTTALLVLVLAVFQSAPPVPASPAQAALRAAKQEGFLRSVRRLLANPAFLLLLFSYSINIGAFYAISTLLNELVLSSFPDSDDAGRIGLLLVASGTAGSLLCGFVLARTARFKETTLVVYVLTLVGMALYTYSFTSGAIWVVYVASAILGFFMTGYLPVGFEFGAELTYPEPEGTSSGLLNGGVQVLGILLTLLYEWVLEEAGGIPANLSLLGSLLLGTAMTAAIRPDLRRQAAQRSGVSDGVGSGVLPETEEPEHHQYDNPVVVD